MQYPQLTQTFKADPGLLHNSWPEQNFPIYAVWGGILEIPLCAVFLPILQEENFLIIPTLSLILLEGFFYRT